MRVLWVVVDALGNDQVTQTAMPRLSRLAGEGHRAVEGGLGVLPALTYPNHATFVTGVAPHVHGVVTNSVWRDDRWVGAETVGPSVSTVFDELAESGLDSVAIFGDQNLVGVCGASAASAHWPPEGVLGSDTPTGLTGYATDAAVLGAVKDFAVVDAALTFVHLDETDAVRHVHGPHSPEADAHVEAVDGALGELLALYSSVWRDTVVVVLSDHDQEQIVSGTAVDLSEEIAAMVDTEDPRGHWRADGTAAYVTPDAGMAAADLECLEGVAAVKGLSSGAHVMWGEPGVVFGVDWGQRGDHGSIRTSRQVAIVGGGHPEVATLARRIQTRVPMAADWAGSVLDVLRNAP